MSEQPNIEQYINGSQQRLLQVLQRLAGHEVTGVAQADLADALKVNTTNVYRDLVNLKHAGLAEQMESGRWRLGPRLAQIALALLEHLDSAQRRIDEVRQRYTRVSG